MGEDRLIIEFNRARFAIDTACIAGIVEAQRLTAVPGRSGFVRGVISLRGEPVAVVDLTKAFDALSGAVKEGAPWKVVVVKEKGHMLGLDIGAANIFFLWEEELKGRPVKEERGRFTSAYIEMAGPIYVIDWQELFKEASVILSPADTNV